MCTISSVRLLYVAKGTVSYARCYTYNMTRFCYTHPSILCYLVDVTIALYIFKATVALIIFMMFQILALLLGVIIL